MKLLGANRHEHQVEVMVGIWTADRNDRNHRVFSGLGIVQGQTVLPKIFQAPAMCHQDHLVSGRQQPTRIEAADHTRAEHENSHAVGPFQL